MSKFIGIDLGTTNSCIATLQNGVPIIIPSIEGTRTTPSVVGFTSDGERLVGTKAKNQAITNPKRTISSIKRKMGTSYTVKIDTHAYSPQEISAIILSKLKKDAEHYLHEEVSDVVITVPAYFTDAMRQATKDAGKIAGLNVLRIINEPTAAALAYGLDRELPQKIMVFDFGGGTLDVSILDINGGVIEVLSTAGNNHLGGDDFDDLLVNYLLNTFKRQKHLDLSKDLNAMVRIKDAAEKAKIELSSSQTSIVSLPFITMDKGTPVNLEITITRCLFDELTKEILIKAKEPILQAISDSKLQISDLSKVLMVGGSSRIPSVARMVKEITNLEPFKGINPDECVALGAAIQSGVLTGNVNGLLLLDVTPLSLGIMTTGDHFSKIIERNSPIPIKQSQIFSTASPYQSSVEVQVLQGERERASANKLLGKFILRGIRKAPAGIPKIEVTFDIDANGIVHVSAKDLDTGKMQDVTIIASNNLSQDEIAKAIHDAKRYEAEDQERIKHRELIEDAKTTLKLAEQKMKTHKEKKKMLKNVCKKLEKALNKKDYNEVQLYLDQLKKELV